MENKLEQLLNSLIEGGWCPFGKKDVYIETGEGYDFGEGFIILKRKKGGTYTCESEYMPYRMLCTKSSGLWQFVCENKMEKKMEKNHRGIWINSWAKSAYQSYPVYTMERYEYRVIESSLKDESELEDFLLQNIKIEG